MHDRAIDVEEHREPSRRRSAGLKLSQRVRWLASGGLTFAIFVFAGGLGRDLGGPVDWSGIAAIEGALGVISIIVLTVLLSLFLLDRFDGARTAGRVSRVVLGALTGVVIGGGVGFLVGMIVVGFGGTGAQVLGGAIFVVGASSLGRSSESC